jgi:uncharacterized membrane protein YoaK (UPF0700 family)
VHAALQSQPTLRPPASASAAPLVSPTGLAGIAGFVDSCTFLAFGGFFVAQATGSYVVAGAGLWNPSGFELIKVAAIPVFMVAGVATTFLIRRFGERRDRALGLSLALEALLLVGLMIVGGIGTSQYAASAACLFGLSAMGVHVALCRLLLPDYGSTNVMTNNTIQFAIDLADSLRNRSLEPRLLRTGRIMAGFLLGVITGGLLFATIGFPCLLLPILALAAMAARPLAGPAR